MSNRQILFAQIIGAIGHHPSAKKEDLLLAGELMTLGPALAPYLIDKFFALAFSPTLPEVAEIKDNVVAIADELKDGMKVYLDHWPAMTEGPSTFKASMYLLDAIISGSDLSVATREALGLLNLDNMDSGEDYPRDLAFNSPIGRFEIMYLPRLRTYRTHLRTYANEDLFTAQDKTKDQVIQSLKDYSEAYALAA